MLLALNVFELQHIALIDNGKYLVFLIVLGLLIQHGEAVELDGKACCLEAAAVCVDINGNGIQQSVCHLACDKSFPDELVKLVLLGSKAVLDSFWSNLGGRGTYSFVSVLCACLGLVYLRRRRQIIFAVCSLNVFVSRSPCLVGNSQAVCSHVGDKTHSAHALDLNAFIKLLSGSHCL